MDQLISNLLAVLPTTATSTPTLQRHATLFGRTLEKLLAKCPPSKEKQNSRQAWEEGEQALDEYEKTAQDVALVQLRGILLNACYLNSIWPEINSGRSSFTWAMLRLCQSKLPSNILTFYECLQMNRTSEITMLLPNHLYKLLQSPHPLVLTIALKIIQQWKDELECEALIPTISTLVRHRELGVRRAAWRLLYSLITKDGCLPFNNLQGQLVKVMMEETHLEVLEAAVGLSPVLDIKQECLDKWHALLEYLLTEDLASVHPILFRRLLRLLPDKIQSIQPFIEKLCPTNIVDVMRGTSLFSRLLSDEKMILIAKCFSNENDYNSCYAGLVILEGCAKELGAKINLFQADLTRILDHSEDEQLSGKCLLILLWLANASNWQKLFKLALCKFPHRKKMPWAEHLLRVKVLNRLVWLVEEFCHENKEDYLKTLLISLGERASRSEIDHSIIKQVNLGSLDLKKISCAETSRVLFQAGIEGDNDQFPIRKKLLQAEFHTKPYNRFEDSIFTETTPRPDRKMVPTSPLAQNEPQPPIMPENELLSEVFLGFAQSE